MQEGELVGNEVKEENAPDHKEPCSNPPPPTHTIQSNMKSNLSDLFWSLNPE